MTNINGGWVARTHLQSLIPRKLTWIPKIMLCKRWLLSNMTIFGIYVRFLGCIYAFSGLFWVLSQDPLHTFICHARGFLKPFGCRTTKHMYFPDLADSFNFSGNRQMENLQKNWDRNLAQSLNMGEKELVAQESKTKTCRFIFILFFFDSAEWNIQPRHWRLRRSTENVQRDHPEMACIFTVGEHQTPNRVHIPAWDNENNGLKSAKR